MAGLHHLREHRGDGHVAALVAAGLDGCQALVLFALSEALPVPMFLDSRGWSADEWEMARAELEVRVAWSRRTGSPRTVPSSDGRSSRPPTGWPPRRSQVLGPGEATDLHRQLARWRSWWPPRGDPVPQPDGTAGPRAGQAEAGRGRPREARRVGTTGVTAAGPGRLAIRRRDWPGRRWPGAASPFGVTSGTASRGDSPSSHPPKEEAMNASVSCWAATWRFSAPAASSRPSTGISHSDSARMMAMTTGTRCSAVSKTT